MVTNTAPDLGRKKLVAIEPLTVLQIAKLFNLARKVAASIEGAQHIPQDQKIMYAVAENLIEVTEFVEDATKSPRGYFLGKSLGVLVSAFGAWIDGAIDSNVEHFQKHVIPALGPIADSIKRAEQKIK